MPTTRERLLRKVRKDANGCWVWTGSRYPTGYGQLWNGRRPEQAHRVSYRLYCGEIPAGREIDHRCRNRACVNPEHLEAVSHRENMRRSDTLMGLNARKSHCLRGHPLDAGNTRVSAQGRRQCRACDAMRSREYKRRRSA